MAEELASWVEGLAPWSLFVTLSTTKPTSGAALQTQVEAYIERLKSAASKPLACFWVVEPGDAFGRFHAHCLIGGAAPPARELVKSEWKAGQSVEVSDYVPGGRIERYVTANYERADFRYGVILPRRRIRRGKRAGRGQAPRKRGRSIRP